MNIEFSENLLKQLQSKKLPRDVETRFFKFCEEVRNAKRHEELRNWKKLIGHDFKYRKRIGKYRIGCYLYNNTIIADTILIKTKFGFFTK